MNIIFGGQNSLPCGEIIIDGSNSNNKAPSIDRAFLQRNMVLSQVIRVRLELTANGLKGHCSTN